jgi:hypothetical protein
MRIDVGHERTRFGRRLKQSDASVDVRQIGAGLGEALFILGDCGDDLSLL